MKRFAEALVAVIAAFGLATAEVTAGSIANQLIGAGFLELGNQASGASPIPFHPGAARYLKERGFTVK